MRPLVLAVALAALLTAGCGQGVTNLPTHRDMADGPAARITGILGDTRGCVYLPAPDGSWMILVWPAGYRLDQGFIRDADGLPIAGFDEPVTLGGGLYDDSEYVFLRTVMPADISASCRQGSYWLVTQVLSPPPSPSAGSAVDRWPC